MATFTDHRIEELRSLKAEGATKEALPISDSKPTAGNRNVPVHSSIAPLVARLCKAAPVDGYLIESSAAGKYGVSSDPLSKRFGRMKTDMGFGPGQVFHSIRKTVATLLEQARLVEGIAADILGHEKVMMSFSLNSDGISMKQKRPEIWKVAYSAPLSRPSDYASIQESTSPT